MPKSISHHWSGQHYEVLLRKSICVTKNVFPQALAFFPSSVNLRDGLPWITSITVRESNEFLTCPQVSSHESGSTHRFNMPVYSWF